ncbi:hypothetical protein GXB81_19615 [Paraburkholderia sp. Ac-20336]|uniref:hypothetical protein n=1 Tax=unclassified Paraburkholderia TaxID=2615204 RepID=UPI0019809253|nr:MULTISPECIES: hypothetical protein [unclassified Paraburkholderia]MBN3805240.1 hypothetical protein [Paraburkholderia sp. Ac-20336]MBN3849784.1 hypothetical protein [Paraburkholderia sp. Ac-20342]
MNMPDFLTRHSASATLDEPFLIGETGFSFGRSQRPTPSLAQWTDGEIPETAREVLQAQSGFSGFTGLIRVATELDTFGVPHAEWVLGKTSLGLLSMVVRDASHCAEHRLRDDVAFAIAEAKRYCAVAAIVFVQQGRNDATRCHDALRAAFDVEVVEADVLYKSGLTSDIPVWFASLSFRQV